jgi:hypothetical protein
LLAALEDGLRDRVLVFFAVAFLALPLGVAFVAVVRVRVVLLAERRRVGFSVADASGCARP